VEGVQHLLDFHRLMDGFQVARRLRGLAESRDASLIALTGYGQEEYRRRCQEAGFDHFLLKPFDLAEVQRVLGEHVARCSVTGVEPAPGD
jgi:CheY-like chemotaxis protein